MAYVLPIEDEEEKKKAESEAIQKQQAGGPSAGEPVSAAGEAPPQKTPTTTGYTDVRSYLEANRPQAAQLGQTYAQRIAGEEETMRGKIGEAEKTFGEQAEAGRVGYEEPFVKQTLEKAGKGFSPGDVERFTKMREAAYGGPMGLTDIADYRTTAAKASEAAKFGKGLEAGESLNEMFYRYGQRPTVGNVALDRMLLMGTPEARQTLTQAGQKLGGLSEYLTGREQTAQERATAAKEEAARTKEMTQAALGEAIGGFETGLSERVAQQRTQAAAQEAALRDLLLNYPGTSLRERVLQGQLPLAEGLPSSSYYDLANVREALEKTYGKGAVPGLAGYAKMIGTPEALITAPTVARPEEYAREAALGELAGYNLPILYETDLSKAGTAPTELAKFDVQRAYIEQMAELKKRDREFINKMKLGKDYSIPTAVMQKTDPKKYADSFKAYEVLARNYEDLDPTQKQFVDVMQGKQVPGSPWDVPMPLPKPPDMPGEIKEETAPWQQGEPRTKFVSNPDGTKSHMWWDGTQWTKAPPEFKYTKNGQPSSPFDADKAQQFDYNTGQYKDIPWTGGGTPPGIVRGF